MSRWLDIAARTENNSNSLTDNRQEPSKSPHAGPLTPFPPVSAGCREGKSDENQKGQAVPLSALMGRFRQRVARLAADENQPRDRAVWLAALDVFLVPDERADFFDGDGLRAGYRQVSFAISGGVVVTFHGNGRVSFHGKPSVNGRDAEDH